MWELCGLRGTDLSTRWQGERHWPVAQEEDCSIPKSLIERVPTKVKPTYE